MKNINQLIKGIKYHKKKQEEWKLQGRKDFIKALSEKRIIKGNKRPGRIDIYLEDEDLIIILEFKCSDWDKMKSNMHVRRNIKRYIRQVWHYLESETIDPEITPTKKNVQIYFIFPEKSKNSERLKIIKEECDKKWVSVVWEDEDINSLRKD